MEPAIRISTSGLWSLNSENPTMFPPDVIKPPTSTSLPRHLIVEFWAQIFTELQTVHGLTAADAATAIVRFRADSDHLVGDMRYHRNWSDVAETIAIGWRSGYLKSLPGTGLTP
jgi:hypothetical protein